MPNKSADPIKIAQRIQERASQQMLDLQPTNSLYVPDDDSCSRSSAQAKIAAQQVQETVFRELFEDALQLPEKPANTTLIPSELVRCALFNARPKNQKRTLVKGRELASVGNQKIEFSGEDLRQDDCDVYLKLIELACDQKHENKPIRADSKICVQFSLYSLAKALGSRSFCSKKKRSMLDSLNRLRLGLLTIQSQRILNQSHRRLSTIQFNLISNLTVTEISDRNYSGHTITCELPLALVFLLQGPHHTRIYWLQRQSLRSNAAKWLLNYLSSHKTPFPVKLTTVSEGAGLQIKEPKNVRRTIRAAAKELIEVGFLASYRIENDILHVVRKNPST